ncbi:MAG: N-sulfoglucosamine sulfohydrolase [Candidatus Omnitrophota bacterium]|jgi:N-sulfoglucosamine sulfohydrolase
MKNILILPLALFLTCSTRAVDLPNILWITAEDMSPTLGCYGDHYSTSPHIDALAKRSGRYTHAYATAPVCSPSRSCLINGLPATSQGTQQMRSAFPIPSSMTGFPALLRKAGYFTSNNVKTDYNSANWSEIIAASWDAQGADAHWRKGPKDRPFFSIFNLMTSHQSRTMVWPYDKFKTEVQSTLKRSEIHDPAKAPIPPYYPDTPVVRKTVARFYDCVTAMDKEVGELLKQLKTDGLEDNTIVFFYSDHGSGMPRHKRALLDSGMHVPLLIHVPEKWQHLAPDKPGTDSDRLVNFADFAPTVLNLAGIPAPEHMEGKPFLGPNSEEIHRFVFGHRDRVDEVLDTARSVHDMQYLYIRTFMPHLGYNQRTAWPDLGEIRPEFYAAAAAGKLTAAQAHFMGPTRPTEELFDCEKDPHNLHNLAESAEHQETLQKMRGALKDHVIRTKDLGFIPEALAWEWSAGSTPYDAARKSYDAAAVFQAANDVGVAENKTFIQHLAHPDAVIRYWGAMGLTAAKQLDAAHHAALKKALSDASISVRIQAADALARHGKAALALPVLGKALQHKNIAAVLHAARTIELMGHDALPLVDAMRTCDTRMKTIRPPGTSPVVVQPGDIDMAMFVGFSTEAFLTRFGRADSGWESLFDGKTLSGWQARAPGTVEVVDGQIQILAKGANLWLVHDKVLDDFELVVEARMPEGDYNSGIGFRCTGAKKPLGYQCEIDRKKSGSIYAIGKGWVLPTNNDWASFHDVAGDCFTNTEWNTFKIRCEGEHIQIWVNGHKTADIQDTRFARGQVALQHHGKGDTHFFRNVRVREL